MRWFRRITTVAALAVLLVLSLVAPAFAAPLTMGRDRSDNGIYFRYDAETRSLPEYGSAITIDSRFDRVTFLLRVGLTPEAKPQPLVARVSLRLHGKRAVRFDGTIVARIFDENGVRVLSLKMPVDRVLRPRAGKRRATLARSFDIASGWYSAYAVFRPAPLAPPDEGP